MLTVVALLLDQVWFLFSFKGFYEPAVTAVTGKPFTFSLFPALLAWVSVAALAVMIHDQCTARARQLAGVFGGLVYAVFNGTVLAIFPNYHWSAAVADTLWGAILMHLLVAWQG